MRSGMERLILVGVASMVGWSCGTGVVNEPAIDLEVASVTGALDASQNSDYFSVRKDNRKCMWPMCGGYFVRQVNQSRTTCADRTRKNECYVVDIRFDELGEFDLENVALVRGNIVAETIENQGVWGFFSPTEVWRSGTSTEPNNAPTGTFYRVTDLFVRCITFPCPWLHVDVVNKQQARTIHDLNLSNVGAPQAEVDAALNALGTQDGAMVAGNLSNYTGPAGQGIVLKASQFYRRLEPRPAQQICGTRGAPPCPEGSFCNFPPEANCGYTDAPGVCEPMPTECIEGLYAPQCGCDNQTYDSPCLAHLAGVAIQHAGACTCDSEPVTLTDGQLVGDWSGSGEWTVTFTFLSDGTFIKADLVAPCPAGAMCFWSGIISNRGTWSMDQREVRLSYANPTNSGYNIAFPAAMKTRQDCNGNLLLDDGTLVYRPVVK